MNEFEVRVELRGPLQQRASERYPDRLDRDEIARLTLTLPREQAMELVAVALEMAEEHGRFAGELTDLDGLG